MKQVRIAELKARLSEYLREVRSGQTITVLDRQTPVAQLAPITKPGMLRVIGPAPGTPPPGQIKLPKGPKLKLDFDIVDFLLEDRRHR